ncbi:MAG: holo-ACP synthase [Cyanobacteria bacterium HKST-UBA03]|nr:holo-ACP synthase [Cyanobacteria bacterium HKST-UBA03]
MNQPPKTTAPIKAIGLDLVYLPRLSRSYQRYGTPMLGKILTPNELTYCLSSRKEPLLIKRFGARIAAKEAVAKCLGIGFSLLGYPDGLSWRSIEVGHEPGNHKPLLSLSGRAAEKADRLGIETWHISLTHDGDYAQAMILAL